jgi:hypothetical protein
MPPINGLRHRNVSEHEPGTVSKDGQPNHVAKCPGHGKQRESARNISLVCELCCHTFDDADAPF